MQETSDAKAGIAPVFSRSPGKLPPRRLATGLGHARWPEINAIGQNRSEESLLICGRRLGAQMQESISQTRPLIDLGQQFSNLDVRHQRIRLFSEGFCGFRGVLAQMGDAQIPSASVTSGNVFSRALRATVVKLSSSLCRHSAKYEGKCVSTSRGSGSFFASL